VGEIREPEDLPVDIIGALKSYEVLVGVFSQGGLEPWAHHFSRVNIGNPGSRAIRDFFWPKFRYLFLKGDFL
jgi:hypothetical protein